MIKFNTYLKKLIISFVILNTYSISFFLNANSILDTLNLPKGFEISIFADNLDSPRQISETDNGFILFGSKKGDNIYALFDKDQDGYAEKRISVLILIK